MKNTATITRDVAIEALSCVVVRARWYATRKQEIPTATMTAIRALCDALEIEPDEVLQ